MIIVMGSIEPAVDVSTHPPQPLPCAAQPRMSCAFCMALTRSLVAGEVGFGHGVPARYTLCEDVSCTLMPGLFLPLPSVGRTAWLPGHCCQHGPCRPAAGHLWRHGAGGAGVRGVRLYRGGAAAGAEAGCRNRGRKAGAWLLVKGAALVTGWVQQDELQQPHTSLCLTWRHFAPPTRGTPAPVSHGSGHPVALHPLLCPPPCQVVLAVLGKLGCSGAWAVGLTFASELFPTSLRSAALAASCQVRARP